MNIQVGTAGLAEELELRLSRVRGLLLTAQLKLDIHAWRGHACDLLIVDLECGYGRLAYEVGMRRKLRILAFGHGDAVIAADVYRVDRDTSAYDVSRLLTDLLLPSQSQASIL